jgi:hypothetical protein
MSSAFTLRVPADPQFRSLANDVVARYVELAGGSDVERSAFVAAVSDAVKGMSGDMVELVCTTGSSGVDITVRAGGRQVAVHHPLPAGKR